MSEGGYWRKEVERKGKGFLNGKSKSQDFRPPCNRSRLDEEGTTREKSRAARTVGFDAFTWIAMSGSRMVACLSLQISRHDSHEQLLQLTRTPVA